MQGIKWDALHSLEERFALRSYLFLRGERSYCAPNTSELVPPVRAR
jgi:hypothetical protein